jgi:hypothetical protein
MISANQRQKIQLLSLQLFHLLVISVNNQVNLSLQLFHLLVISVNNQVNLSLQPLILNKNKLPKETFLLKLQFKQRLTAANRLLPYLRSKPTLLLQPHQFKNQQMKILLLNRIP